MKLLLILINVFSILSLILAQNTASEEECQIYNSLANKIYSNSKNVTINCCNDDYSQCNDGHITKIEIGISEVPSSINKLTELEELHLKDIKEIPNEVYQLKKLKKLDIMTAEGIKVSPLIAELTELEDLRISIDGKVSDEFFSLTKLKNLELKLGDSNNEQNIDLNLVISKLTELEKLIIERGGIKIIPDEISQLKKLKELNIRKNLIETIPLSIKDMPTLEILDLSDNKIKEVPKEILQLTPKLTLNLKGNPLCDNDSQFCSGSTTIKPLNTLCLAILGLIMFFNL